MRNYFGYSEATKDTKGRFLLPVSVRKVLPNPEQTQFTINVGFDGCLTLWVKADFDRIASNIASMNQLDTRNRTLRRNFSFAASDVELDSAGRILIQKTLLEHAGIEKDIVLSGAGSFIEIWDRAKYLAKMDESLPRNAEIADSIQQSSREEYNPFHLE